MNICKIITVSALLLGISQLAQAEELKLEYGVNNIDINADGLDDVIVKSRWENGNAHSFDRFYTMLASKNIQGQFYEVPVGETGYNAPHFFETRENYSCPGFEPAHTSKIIFKRQKDGEVIVQKFFLESGRLFEKRSAFVKTYHLVDTAEEFGMGGNIGAGLHFWKKVKTLDLKGKYCDAKNAIPAN